MLWFDTLEELFYTPGEIRQNSVSMCGTRTQEAEEVMR